MSAVAIFSAGSAEARRSQSQPEREVGLSGIGLPEGNGTGGFVQTKPAADIFSDTLSGPERSAVASRTYIRSRVQPKAGGPGFSTGGAMTPSRHLTYLLTVALCLAVIVTAAQISLTPDLLAAARIVLAGAFANVVVQAVLVTIGFVWLISLCALSWDKAERRHADWCARQEEVERGKRNAA